MIFQNNNFSMSLHLLKNQNYYYGWNVYLLTWWSLKSIQVKSWTKNEILEDVESLDEVELDLRDRLVTKKSEEHLTTLSFNFTSINWEPHLSQIYYFDRTSVEVTVVCHVSFMIILSLIHYFVFSLVLSQLSICSLTSSLLLLRS